MTLVAHRCYPAARALSLALLLGVLAALLMLPMAVLKDRGLSSDEAFLVALLFAAPITAGMFLSDHLGARAGGDARHALGMIAMSTYVVGFCATVLQLGMLGILQ